VQQTPLGFSLMNDEFKSSFASHMIKPIVFRHIEEKEALERKLMTTIPKEKRASAFKFTPKGERLVHLGSKKIVVT
jgi:hypothetical protein